ncbi:PHD finger protein MALE MEIOCYTE DEATH 1 [Ananas comosus]|uniref:PHD finger protein MALE MEIOCYTE DEATH 1 n=1 Tax=Ananas comosus TaxID=4615 RepID=A0A199UYH4_ANACO|nr:PHD finger protein MALE MEIOCYTE DEATH 1 [Ananas comosus]
MFSSLDLLDHVAYHVRVRDHDQHHAHQKAPRSRTVCVAVEELKRRADLAVEELKRRADLSDRPRSPSTPKINNITCSSWILRYWCWCRCRVRNISIRRADPIHIRLISQEIPQVLEEFGDVMPHELVAQALQRRAVYHKIEFEPRRAEEERTPTRHRMRPCSHSFLSPCHGESTIRVEDVSYKRSMDPRLLHGVTYGYPWFGRWGYRFCYGSFGVTKQNSERAIDILSEL